MMLLRRMKVASIVLMFSIGCARSEENVIPKATEMLQLGKYDDAAKLLSEAIAQTPKDNALFKLRGRAYAQLKNHAKAAEDITHVAEAGESNLFRLAGDEHFFAGNFDASIKAFDACAKAYPEQAPQLWERGISLYYAKRYADGRKQFEDHKTVNPHDVENAAWHFICAAKEMDVDAARKVIIYIDTNQDTRVPMKQVYQLFKGEGKPDDVLAAATVGNPDPEALKNNLCYAHLYLGLYAEALGDGTKAREHFQKAAVPFSEEHYMGQVARVHWELIKDKK